MVIKPVKGMVLAAAAFIALFVANPGGAMADEPRPMEMWHQPAATETMAYITWFDRYTLFFIVPIVLFVLFLLIWIGLRFRAKVNPVASKTSHNTLIEVIWTGGPILVLVCMAIPSFDLLNRQLAPKEQPQMTIKVSGHQWYWSYEYQDDANISFDQLMLGEEDRDAAGKADKAAYPRLLAVDNEVVVPVNTMVRLLVTSQDVIHSYTVPSFGFKIDAMPGRMNETWFKAEREGLFYGQCSELCGKDHAFMPTAFRVVSAEKYTAWKAAAASDLDGANKALMSALESENATRVAANQAAPKVSQ